MRRARRFQSDLFYDYRTNVEGYPKWQAWLQKTQPKLLVLWGKHDLSLDLGEPERYRQDVPKAEVIHAHAGHFALDTEADRIAALVREFTRKNSPKPIKGTPIVGYFSHDSRHFVSRHEDSLGRFIAPKVGRIQLSVSTLIMTHIGRSLSDCEAGNHCHYFQGVARCHPDTGWKPMLH